MARIPEEVIDQVRNQADIVDIIGNYVQLKKQGRNYAGLCPFHGEKTPSFSVSPEKQIFHCFGCGKGGNVFSFLMEHDGLTFVEAVKKVADMSHLDVAIELPEERDTAHLPKETSETAKMVEMHQLTAKLYHYILMETEEGTAALTYLKERGMSEQMMANFQIGFAPNHHATVTSFLEKRGMDLQLAGTAGLLSERDDGQMVDRFRNRIIFPITNDRGQIIAFSGRLFDRDDGPKYLNSPETPLFNKRRTLFHFSEARQAIRKQEEITLMEGFMDVISAEEAGIQNAVASMGTSLTEEHADLIKRLTSRAIICYDGDRAGIEAAYKAGTLLVERNRLDVFVLQLPAGKDPDDFIRSSGADKFKEIYKQQRMTWTAFKIHYLRRERNLQNETDQIGYIDDCLREIAKLDQAVERELYLKQLADEFELTIETLKQQLQQSIKTSQKSRQTASYNEPPIDDSFMGIIPQENPEILFSFEQPMQKLSAHTTAEQQLMKAMMESRDSFLLIKQLLGETEFYHDNYQALYTYLIGYFAEGNDADPNKFMDSVQDVAMKGLISSLEMVISPEEQGRLQFEDYIRSLKRFKLEQKKKELEQELAGYNRDNDKENEIRVMLEIVQLNRQLNSGQLD
ncbi:DNA primase [Listeria ivanovii]|uniref:DNA primase n=1 Tax=Listeria ivanovii TaxID=1638 RepID=UPI000512746D|nr:DNA primase [Listeria ivanovii]AIS62687.1 DNA primase [Listeria ivanovii subsp. londoniensis]MBK1967270.1 DNA primase [Listeria ivanovii subsp. londoniensis]MBK1985208.1 DNA primase [Listeria ivanovii subsp. londoniensis]MBK1996618.1 DNA primase [Listeria ivanovii subsp. londoniensis]